MAPAWRSASDRWTDRSSIRRPPTLGRTLARPCPPDHPRVSRRTDHLSRRSAGSPRWRRRGGARRRARRSRERYGRGRWHDLQCPSESQRRRERRALRGDRDLLTGTQEPSQHRRDGHPRGRSDRPPQAPDRDVEEQPDDRRIELTPGTPRELEPRRRRCDRSLVGARRRHLKVGDAHDASAERDPLPSSPAG